MVHANFKGRAKDKAPEPKPMDKIFEEMAKVVAELTCNLARHRDKDKKEVVNPYADATSTAHKVFKRHAETQGFRVV